MPILALLPHRRRKRKPPLLVAALPLLLKDEQLTRREFITLGPIWLWGAWPRR